MTLHNRPARRLPRLILLALVLLGSLNAAPPARAQEAGAAPPAPDQKISAALAAAVAALPGPGLAAAGDEPLRDGPVATYNGRIQVIVATRPAEIAAAREAIAAAGGELMANGPGDETVQAWVPPGALAALAAEPSVLALRLPDILQPLEEGAEPTAAGDGVSLQTGAVVSEGVAAMGAATWHSKGVTGRGVKVGVIDLSFRGASALLGNELPQNTTWKSFVDNVATVDTGGTSIGHGTQCAAVIADVAPGAQLYLATALTAADTLEAVNWMAAQGVKVISMSIGSYIGGPGDGTGEYATIINAAKAKGILMVVAAGNQRRFHWNGPFVDSDGNQMLEFAPGAEYNCLRSELASGCTALPKATDYYEPMLEIQMRWADSWTAPGSNLNLYLFRRPVGGSWTQVAKSETVQSGAAGQLPTEEIRYVLAETASSTQYEFAVGIKKGSGPAPANIDLFVKVNNSLAVFNEMTLRYRTTSRSLSIIGAAPGALTVGALDVKTLAHAPYSAEGPTNGPGDKPGVGIVKPDIAGYANVAINAGGKPFEGTSAATPHVAGAAALVAQLLPNASRPEYLRSYLTKSALDMGPAGKDSTYGAGQLRLLDIPLLNPYDSNFDGRADLVWHNQLSGNGSILPISESGLAPGGKSLPNLHPAWRIVGRGDLNGDGISDIVLRHTQNGDTRVWLMKPSSGGSAIGLSSHVATVSTIWRIMDVADFNGDRKADLMWQSLATGSVEIWLMDGALKKQAISVWGVPVGHTAYAADFNADGRSDILLRNQSLGSNIVWIFDGAKVSAKLSIAAAASSAVKLVGPADFDGDGDADLLWKFSDSSYWIWFMKGTEPVKVVGIGKVAVEHTVAGLADINGDLMADLVARNLATGKTAGILLNGKALASAPFASWMLSAVSIPSPLEPSWTIAGMLPYVPSAAPASVGQPAPDDTTGADFTQAGADWALGPAGELPPLGPVGKPDDLLGEGPSGPFPGDTAAATTIYLPLLSR